MKFEVYKSQRDKEWRWRLMASNGRIIADGAESYKRRGGCLKGIAAVRTGIVNAMVETITISPRRVRPMADTITSTSTSKSKSKR